MIARTINHCDEHGRNIWVGGIIVTYCCAEQLTYVFEKFLGELPVYPSPGCGPDD